MSYIIINYLITLLVTVHLIGCVSALAYEREMTISVDAGKIDCFFHKVAEQQIIDIEYQVIDGGHGELDISFILADPIGLIIVNDFKKSENIVRHEVRKGGDFRFCFDNSFSTINRKTVFFEIIIDGGEEEQHAGDGPEHIDGLTPEEVYEITVQEIMDYIGRIKMHITKARQLQDILRSHEARDRNLAEANFHKVNTQSMCQLVIMVLVSLLQVYMLRSIFETNSSMSKLWKRLKF